MTETWVSEKKMRNADTNLMQLYYIRVSWLGPVNKNKEICFHVELSRLSVVASNLKIVLTNAIEIGGWFLLDAFRLRVIISMIIIQATLSNRPTLQ